MAFLDIVDERVPEPIRVRVKKMREEVDKINDAAMANFKAEIPRRVSFKVSSNSDGFVDGDLMSAEERAQAVSFVVRYEHLRDDIKVHIGFVNGEWHIKNIWELRHMLNDVRPIIQSQNDSTYYANVNATIQKRLRRNDPAKGLIVQAYEGDSENEITTAFAAYLAENTKAIATIINNLEYGYLYNGILQHSDAEYSKRLVQDYTSGELNYILWKHVIVLGQIQYWLKPFYQVMSILNFPKLGSLIVA